LKVVLSPQRVNDKNNIQKEDDMTQKNEPVKKVRYGRIEVAIWKNEGKERPFYTTTLTRSYKDDDGTWKQSSSLSGSELLVAAQAYQETFRTIEELKRSDAA